MKTGRVVNDVHSRLSPTRVAEVVPVRSAAEVRAALLRAARDGLAVGVAGGRHAMGGQPFAAGGMLLDMRGMDRIVRLDAARGLVEVEPGLQWPALVAGLLTLQSGRQPVWSIAQKQTGADRLTIGGAVAANVHGRGLRMRPFVSDVEALELVMADGRRVRASRTENNDLFELACGGYGLFGVVVSVMLRLVPRRKLRRRVAVVGADEVVARVEERIAAGCPYGDFQFAIDEGSPDFLRRGVLSCYEPVAWSTPITPRPRELDADGWMRLLELAHTRKSAAFAAYAAHYRATDGQVYWSDTHQLAFYLDDYHRELDRRLGACVPGTEAIGEVFVPRALLVPFLGDAAHALRQCGASVVYGTVRFVEKDTTSFLAWARKSWATVVLNLHVDHTAAGRARVGAAFRALYDLALGCGGSFYLTYGRWARPDQLRHAYPQLGEFLAHKRRFDPEERLASDFYRWLRRAVETSTAAAPPLAHAG